MATTSTRISELAVGIRDTAGAVVASGKARFYNPGTLVEATVYSDAACTTPITQPQTLNAGGQATVYTLEPVRMIVKNSAETVTYYDDIVNLTRHDSVYITHSSFNSGTETTLENLLTTLGTNLGPDGKYKESASATAVTYTTWLGELCVSVKDFGALGDDNNDDTAEIQAAIDRVEARGGGWVYFPKGTYKISSALSIDTAGVKIFGAGRGIAVIKNYGTTTNAITVNLGSAVDSKITIRDVSITCSTTSSGKAIEVTNGDKVIIRDVTVALHRTGIDTSAVSGSQVQHCFVDSTDDNTNGVGVTVGARGRLDDCEIVCGTINGTGIVLAADARAVDCYVTKFATGATLSGARTRIRGGHFAGGQTTGISIVTGGAAYANECFVTGATTGISLNVANAHARDCTLTSCTTGISVGAVASCTVVGCDGASNTTDLSVNASATLFHEHNPGFTTYTNTGASSLMPERRRQTTTTSADANPSWTPTHSPSLVNHFVATNTSGATLTINAPTTTNAQVDDLIWILLQKDGTNGLAVTWNAIFVGPSGNAFTSAPAAGTATATLVIFRWTGTQYRMLASVRNFNT